MNNVSITISKKEDLKKLLEIYSEAIPYFLTIEGRKPLKPFEDIREIIGNPPEDEELNCHTIWFDDEVVGYAWTLEKPKEYYYILHFYIRNDNKKMGIGRKAVQLLDTYFVSKDIYKSELLVSGSNYLGLKFWTEIGYDKIIYVEAPEENSATNSVEIELSRMLKF